jgi:hypothetical protein
MKLKSAVMPVLALAATIGLTACETTPRTMSTTEVPSAYTYNPVPPRLVRGGSGISNDTYACTSPFPGMPRPSKEISAEYDCKDTTKATRVSWDHPDRFGPVPVSLQRTAQSACDTLGAGYIASGYHPAAQYYDGTTSATGGYYCRKV